MSKTKWIIKRYAGKNYPPEVQSRFNEWFAIAGDESEKDAALKELWDEVDAAPDGREEHAYRRFLARLDGKLTRPFRDILLRIAAVAAVLAVGVFVGIGLSDSLRSKVQLAELFVPNGEIRTVTLPDGSEVTLNGGSLLIYPERFSGQERSVYLSGRGRFSVEKQPGKRFIVSTSDLRVEVLGTVFNVSSYAEDATASVSLKEGRVRVHAGFGANGREFNLMPGEQVRYNRLTREALKTGADSAADFGWTDGSMFLNELSMEEIVRMAEHRYGVRIHLASNRYANASITAKIIHGETLAEFLELLKSLLPGMTCEIDGKTVYIY